MAGKAMWSPVVRIKRSHAGFGPGARCFNKLWKHVSKTIKYYLYLSHTYY